MNILQTIKTVVLKFPTAKVDNATVTATSLDCRGFSEARLDVILGDTDIGITALKLEESANSDMSSPSDVPECSFTGAALPGSTDDNKIYSFHVDLRGRKRYLRPLVTVGDGSTGAFVDVIGHLAGGAEHPSTAATRGLAGERFAKG